MNGETFLSQMNASFPSHFRIDGGLGVSGIEAGWDDLARDLEIIGTDSIIGKSISVKGEKGKYYRIDEFLRGIILLIRDQNEKLNRAHERIEILETELELLTRGSIPTK